MPTWCYFRKLPNAALGSFKSTKSRSWGFLRVGEFGAEQEVGVGEWLMALDPQATLRELIASYTPSSGLAWWGDAKKCSYLRIVALPALSMPAQKFMGIQTILVCEYRAMT